MYVRKEGRGAEVEKSKRNNKPQILLCYATKK
jgi:hypothetical protein